MNHVAASHDGLADRQLLAETVRRDTLTRLKDDVYDQLTAMPSRAEVIALINTHLECRRWH